MSGVWTMATHHIWRFGSMNTRVYHNNSFQNDEIVLSISQSATKDLIIDNEWISFHARFGGVAQEVWVPVNHVMSIFAKETGEGMGFEVIPYTPNESTINESMINEPNAKKKVLKLVK